MLIPVNLIWIYLILYSSWDLFWLLIFLWLLWLLPFLLRFEFNFVCYILIILIIQYSELSRVSIVIPLWLYYDSILTDLSGCILTLVNPLIVVLLYLTLNLKSTQPLLSSHLTLLTTCILFWFHRLYFFQIVLILLIYCDLILRWSDFFLTHLILFWI